MLVALIVAEVVGALGFQPAFKPGADDLLVETVFIVELVSPRLMKSMSSSKKPESLADFMNTNAVNFTTSFVVMRL